MLQLGELVAALFPALAQHSLLEQQASRPAPAPQSPGWKAELVAAVTRTGAPQPSAGSAPQGACMQPCGQLVQLGAGQRVLQFDGLCVRRECMRNLLCRD